MSYDSIEAKSRYWTLRLQEPEFKILTTRTFNVLWCADLLHEDIDVMRKNVIDAITSGRFALFRNAGRKTLRNAAQWAGINSPKPMTRFIECPHCKQHFQP